MAFFIIKNLVVFLVSKQKKVIIRSDDVAYN